MLLWFFNVGELIYPNGGRYRATWVRGKGTNGQYFFSDNLEYKVYDWDYITPEDRRFYAETLGGFRPQGIALQTNNGKAESIPYGTYNTGEETPQSYLFACTSSYMEMVWRTREANNRQSRRSASLRTVMHKKA
ncbi:MORN repeat-containing protein [Besnoitia besnoiti]|uniref:MORN repeat-containing protein n=1 Tax=Besnoitia besnoiti TaxID=94643 RepID=A0A2A9M861_BESBE|nr:MORN repeat-containing protein [Besnoitia besnoiti]PFH34668.1 MORN repeat-containing protein [Besnoitia besnoiti]